MAAVLAASPAAARDESPKTLESLQSGDKVRVQTTSGAFVHDRDDGCRYRALPDARATGRILTLDDETIELIVDGHRNPVRLTRSAIEAASIRVGRSRGKPALVAGLVGFGLGFVLGAPCSGDGELLCGMEWGVIVGTVFGVGAAILGASIGSERWEPLGTKGPVKVTLSPTRTGLGARLTLGF
jgi:hypothetical protein